MSPRAACRLERLGFDPVYDYASGKADWRAAGLPTEGRPHPPRVLDTADRTPPTCGPDETVAVVVERLSRQERAVAVVVGPDHVVLGRVRIDRVDATDTRPVEAVMEPGPATVRADADLEETLARMRQRHVTSLLVTTADGELLGELRA